MIHLKKYNEDKQFSLYDSCKDVFVELLYDRFITLEDREDKKKKSVLLKLNNKFLPNYKDGNFFNYLNMSEKWFEALKDIEVGYKRLKDEFGEIDFYIYDYYDSTSIMITTEKDYIGKLIKKIKDIINEYGIITTLEAEADSILYKQDTEYYYIESFSKDSVTAVSYDDNGNDVGTNVVPYEDLEIYILEEIYEILETAIEEGFLE